MHDPQAHPLSPRRRRWKARAIVLDLQNQARVVGTQAQENVFGPAVFDGVGGGFLGDAVKMDRHCVVRGLDLPLAVQFARDRKKRAQILRQLLQGGLKVVGVQHRRAEAAGEAAGLRQGLVEEGSDVAGGLRLGHSIGLELLMQNLGQEGNARHGLAQAVVQVLAQPALLAFADFLDFPLQGAALRHVAQDAQMEVRRQLSGGKLNETQFALGPGQGKLA